MRPVHFHVEIEKDCASPLRDMFDQGRLTDLAGAEDDPDLIVSVDLLRYIMFNLTGYIV